MHAFAIGYNKIDYLDENVACAVCNPNAITIMFISWWQIDVGFARNVHIYAENV